MVVDRWCRKNELMLNLDVEKNELMLNLDVEKNELMLKLDLRYISTK